MTIDLLKDLKNTHPFEKFTVHMADGNWFEVDDPEDVVIRKDWNVSILLLRPKGRFSIVYLKNITHIVGEGSIPKITRRRGRSGDAGTMNARRAIATQRPNMTTD